MSKSTIPIFELFEMFPEARAALRKTTGEPTT